MTTHGPWRAIASEGLHIGDACGTPPGLARRRLAVDAVRSPQQPRGQASDRHSAAVRYAPHSTPNRGSSGSLGAVLDLSNRFRDGFSLGKEEELKLRRRRRDGLWRPILRPPRSAKPELPLRPR